MIPIIGVMIALSVLPIRQIFSQALDVGGIELHLGQPATEAVQALSGYQLRYSDESKGWTVTQRGESPYELLGYFSAKDGKVAFISKSYHMSSQYDAQRIYNVASQELRRRGGTACTTRVIEYTDDLVHEFETQCGGYRLSYYLPSRLGSDNVDAGISISVRSR